MKNNIYVYDSLFKDIESIKCGGAISSTNGFSTRLCIEETIFSQCKTSGIIGGAVYFCCGGKSQCVIYRVCGFNCSSLIQEESYGQCFDIEIDTDSSLKNQLKDSTITHCKKDNSQLYYAVELLNGNIFCPSVNISNNDCFGYSALHFSPTINDNNKLEVTCNISYSSFVNNTAETCVCININMPGSSQIIDSSNIIRNIQKTTRFGSIKTNGNLLVKYSCIVGNKGKNVVFHEINDNSMITISNCTLENDIIRDHRYSGGFTIAKSNKKFYVISLSHIATYNCDSFFDYYPTPTLHHATRFHLMEYFSQYENNGLVYKAGLFI